MKRRMIPLIIYMILGLVLFGLGFAGIIDEFWSGMGGGLLAVGLMRTVQLIRLKKDESYREKTETEIKDERNCFIRNKAWAWAGYLFILIAAVAVIVLKLAGQELLCMAAGWAVCLLLVLYWVAYLILKRKY